MVKRIKRKIPTKEVIAKFRRMYGYCGNCGQILRLQIDQCPRCGKENGFKKFETNLLATAAYNNCKEGLNWV